MALFFDVLFKMIFMKSAKKTKEITKPDQKATVSRHEKDSKARRTAAANDVTKTTSRKEK